MESVFIILLIGVLLLENRSKYASALFDVLRSDGRGFIKYLGSAAVLSLVMSALPSEFLTVYMRYHGFFAFELFGEQQHAFQVIGLNVFANFLALSAFLYAAFLARALKADKAIIRMSYLASAILLCTMIAVALSSGRWILALVVLAFCAVIAGYLWFLTSSWGEKSKRWWIPLAFACALAAWPLIPTIGWRSAAVLTENALFQMRVGGMDVEISEPLGFAQGSPHTSIKARLMLRTPEFYYLKLGDSILILPTEHVSLKYKSA